MIAKTQKTIIEKNVLAILFLAAGFVFACSAPYVMAGDGDEGISNYLWSKASSDGHRSMLDCLDAPHADICDIPYDLASNINNIAGDLSTSQIRTEASHAESNVNGFNVYIDVREASSSQFDVRPSNLGSGLTATYMYEQHCTHFWWRGWCTDSDSYFVDFDIKVNTNNAFDFGTDESCDGELPTKWDLEKVLGHVLFHMFGSEHATSSDSIVYKGGYVCDTGKVPTSHDKSAIDRKFGPRVMWVD